MQIIGQVLNGDLVNRHLLDNAIKQHEGQRVTVTVKKYVNRRSTRQNAYYYGVVIPALVKAGNERGCCICPEALHLYLKGQIGGFKKAVEQIDGTVTWEVDTSTKLTTAEWEDWMTKIRVWAAEQGLMIPMPNEGDICELSGTANDSIKYTATKEAG